MFVNKTQLELLALMTTCGKEPRQYHVAMHRILILTAFYRHMPLHTLIGCIFCVEL
ncbi:hypothetical protein T01_8552 [Trichinella spiralis]|uniref:Uncharacterized protein n=1 Tax=Trichinella spiralis TaxID=6334 RepID=A0A0V0ZD92_TRISP|nr:hypothetical protein T01_8552 [Trichinella spiralis]